MKKPILIICTIGLVLSVAGGYGVWKWRQQQIIPSKINKQINFTIYLPDAKPVFEINRESFKYDKEIELLSFKVDTYENSISVDEQKVPASFSQESFDKQFFAFEKKYLLITDRGNAIIVYPKKLDGGQTAALKIENTLIFATTKKEMSETQWRQFFNSLKVAEK